MNIRCMKQSSRLSILVGQISQHSSSHQYPHQNGCCLLTRQTCHSHQQLDKNINGHYTPADIPLPSQQDTTEVIPPHLSLWTVRKFYYKCRKQIHSPNASPNSCSMAKHFTTNLTLSPTSMVSFINMP